MYAIENDNGNYYCEELTGTIIDDVQGRLYAIAERQCYLTPYQIIHDESELPGADTDPEDLNEWEKAAAETCGKYLEAGGTYPFYLVANPGQTPENTFECWEGEASSYCWQSLLDEWLDNGYVHYFESGGVARLIDEAIQEGNDKEAAAIIEGVFILTKEEAYSFLDVLKAMTGVNGELRDLIETDNGETDVIFKVADVAGTHFCELVETLEDENDEAGLNRIIDTIEKELNAAIQKIDAKYETTLENIFF